MFLPVSVEAREGLIDVDGLSEHAVERPQRPPLGQNAVLDREAQEGRLRRALAAPGATPDRALCRSSSGNAAVTPQEAFPPVVPRPRCARPDRPQPPEPRPQGPAPGRGSRAAPHTSAFRPARCAPLPAGRRPEPLRATAPRRPPRPPR